MTSLGLCGFPRGAPISTVEKTCRLNRGIEMSFDSSLSALAFVLLFVCLLGFFVRST